MKIGVVTNADKDKELAYTRTVMAFLIECGNEPVLLDLDTAHGAALCRDVAFVVVLGGDGTMLHASHQAALYDTPMIGINLGMLGYLTDVDRQEGLAALDRLLKGAYRRERRMMLTIAGDEAAGEAGAGTTEGLPIGERLALNDVCLSRNGFGKLIHFDLFINGLYMDSLRADGVIVATPTGSTAYNLSAGGPILTPDGEMMVVTAVCPHALYTRPWVVSANDAVTIRAADEHAAVVLDGEWRFALKQGESVLIRRAAQTATILKTSPMSFYEILRQKIGKESVPQWARLGGCALEKQTADKDI